MNAPAEPTQSVESMAETFFTPRVCHGKAALAISASFAEAPNKVLKCWYDMYALYWSDEGKAEADDEHGDGLLAVATAPAATLLTLGTLAGLEVLHC